MKNKLTNNIELFLQGPKGVKKSWIRSLLTQIICIAIFIVVITLSHIYGPMSGKAEWTGLGQSFYQTVNAPYIESATWISVVGLCLLGVPLIYIFSVWMIGINQVSKSKQFHLFMWFVSFVVATLAIIAAILLIRASIFSYNSEYIVISTGDDTETETKNYIIDSVITLFN